MELASVIINVGLFIATVIAAIIAWRGVVDAREARDEAKDAAERAATAAESSATAQGRIAEATEKHAALVEAATAPREPWRLSKVGEHRWQLTNLTGVNVDFVHLSSKPEGHLQLDGANDYCDVRNGASVFFIFGGGFSDPSSLDVTVQWRQPGVDGQPEWTRSIS